VKKLPKPIKTRSEINLRLGIKSSLPKINELIGLFLSLYVVNEDKCKLHYSTENNGQINIVNELMDKLNNFFSYQITKSNTNNFNELINVTPLFKTHCKSYLIYIGSLVKLLLMMILFLAQKNEAAEIGTIK
jgi:hypothetical protein